MKKISILAIILYLVFTFNLKAADHTVLNIKKMMILYWCARRARYYY